MFSVHVVRSDQKGCKKIKINTLTFFFNQGFSLLLLLFLDQSQPNNFMMQCVILISSYFLF